MRISGKCHCGNISLSLTVPAEAQEIAARACGCSFCVKHGGVWAAPHGASLRVRVQDPALVTPYLFGTRTARFHVCTRCGVVPVVTSEIAGRVYAVVSVNALEGLDPARIRRAAVSFDGEGEAERLARRARAWIADVAFG